MYGSLRNVRKSQKCSEVSEMYLKTLLYIKTVQKYGKSDKKRSDNGQTDREAERQTDKQTDRKTDRPT